MKNFVIRTLALLALFSTLVGAPAFAAFRSGSATQFITTSSTSSYSINKPVGVASGDIIIIGFITGNNSSPTVSSSGFTVGDALQVPSAINQGPHGSLSWLWKVATGSEPASYTVSISTGVGTDVESFAGAWTGRNTTSPITANSQVKTAGGNSPFTFSLTGVTAAAGDDLICITIAAQSASAVWTPPSGFTTGLALQTATPFANAYFAFENNVAAGATGLIRPIETGIGTDNIGFVIALAASPSVTNGVVLSNGHPIKSGSSILFQ